VKDYNFETGLGLGGVTGHFTQIVWKGTSEVGFGISLAKSNRWFKMYCVANYYLPGNIRGQYTSNVFPEKYDFNFQM
jgi:hypothetical protein